MEINKQPRQRCKSTCRGIILYIHTIHLLHVAAPAINGEEHGYERYGIERGVQLTDWQELRQRAGNERARHVAYRGKHLERAREAAAHFVGDVALGGGYAYIIACNAEKPGYSIIANITYSGA